MWSHVRQDIESNIFLILTLTELLRDMKLLLTHLPLDKMAAILSDNIFKRIFVDDNDKIPIQISLKLVPRSPIDNKPALVQVMAWRQPGDMPLP